MNLVRQLFVVVSTAAMMMGSVQAQLTNRDVGTLSPSVQQQTGVLASGGAFSDIYNFTIATGVHTLGTSAVSYSPTGTGYASDLAITAYGGAGGTGSTLATVSSSNGGMIERWRELAAGTFSVKVSGMADTQVSGGYDLSIAAMPEPAGWMMLLVGLVIVTFMARRKTSVVTG